MMQIYFLSIVINILAGLVLLKTKSASSSNPLSEDSLIEDNTKKNKIINKINTFLLDNELFNNKAFILVIGILSLLIGVIKFFVVANNGLLILGDFLPAIFGIAGGFAILLNYYLSTASQNNKMPKFIQLIFIDNIYFVGITCLLIAILHFIMPGVLFF